MKRKHSIIIGKAVKKLAALRGGGSALPGLVIEKIDKNFMKHSLKQLPKGVVLVSGTNGKTTTAKMVAELLQSNGLRVFTNKTGSNFTRGVAAALISAVDRQGKLNYDIAVLELDEAYAAHFVRQVAPRYSLILNVMRDQLDRFGEIDHTARLLQTVATHTTDGVVLNRDDPRVNAIAESLKSDVEVSHFGSSQKLRTLFVNDDELHAPADQKVSAQPMRMHPNDVELEDFKETTATFLTGSQRHTASLKLTGVYNFLNAAGALALCKMILKDETTDADLIKSLESVTPAFGRGEIFKVNNAPLELILVKNPAGFRLALSSFSPKDTDIMIAINDRYADGRDMSWLWDVDFTGLKSGGVQTISGVRAYDMALRLQYDDVTVTAVETDIEAALKAFVFNNPATPKRIFCTYSAMLALRKSLNRYTEVERIS